MPLLENDVIFAYLNELDPHHEAAERIFTRLQEGELTLDTSSVSLVEMELIYRSEGRGEDLLAHLSAIAALPSVKYAPLTPDLVIAGVYLRQTHALTFFDSNYAANALNLDRQIISYDRAYDKVPGLTRIDPETI
ncbi:MAG: PIN domain-containing protein [Candidatus Bathyarchaeota archaeon]|nr:PIN domain-containing protein [Candidatus Bathyarchaeota archaeon]